MKQIIKTSYGKITIETNLNLEEIKYFIYTFLPYGNFEKILYNIKHIQSEKTIIKFYGKNITIYDNWVNGIPRSFIIFLNHLLAKKLFDIGNIFFHGGTIFDKINGKCKLIIGDTGVGKTSSILKLISN